MLSNKKTGWGTLIALMRIPNWSFSLVIDLFPRLKSSRRLESPRPVSPADGARWSAKRGVIHLPRRLSQGYKEAIQEGLGCSCS
jgi:hypothetical protein